MATTRKRAGDMNFPQMSKADVPQGRNGKHKDIVTRILADLAQTGPGSAIKVPLADLTVSKEKLRSAVNRAGRKARRSIATASDENYLYLWNEPMPEAENRSPGKF
jgi:hypothetical protein